MKKWLEGIGLGAIYLWMGISTIIFMLLFVGFFLPSIHTFWIVPFSAGYGTEKATDLKAGEEIILPKSGLNMQITGKSYLSKRNFLKWFSIGSEYHVIVEGVLENNSEKALLAKFSSPGTGLYLNGEEISVMTGGKRPVICGDIYDIDPRRCYSNDERNSFHLEVFADSKRDFYLYFEVDEDLAKKYISEDLEFEVRVREGHYDDYFEIDAIKKAKVCEWDDTAERYQDDAEKLRSCLHP